MWMIWMRIISLPKHWGMFVLHVLPEVHWISAVPSRTKPSSQVIVQLEPKLNSPWGSEQFKTPWSGDSRVGHLLAGMEEKREGLLGLDAQLTTYVYRSVNEMIYLPMQSGTSAFHVPAEVHSVPEVPFRRKPSSQVVLQREPKLNSPWAWEHSMEPKGGGFRGEHLWAAEEQRWEPAKLEL